MINTTNLTINYVQRNISDFSLPITINECRIQCFNYIQNLPTTNQTLAIIYFILLLVTYTQINKPYFKWIYLGLIGGFIVFIL